MYLNKENRYKEGKCKDGQSNEYELKSNTLDMLYKEQLTELRELILKTADTHDIEICYKWLKVFHCTSKEEKIARNCLCALMQQQIKECGCLQAPFTNLQNCNRNLDSILLELDSQQHIESLNSCMSNVTFQSHNYPVKTDVEPAFELQEDNGSTIVQERKNAELKALTNELSQKLEILQLQLTEKQIENLKLKEIAEKCRFEREELENTLNNIKISILKCLNVKLHDIQRNGLIGKQFQFFAYIFSIFSMDKEFMDSINQYDSDFQFILNSSFQCEIDNRKNSIARHLCHKFIKTKLKLREKYERQLAVQNQTYKLQLEFIKLKSLSIIRQLYINSCNESAENNLLEILKTFDEKYQDLLNTD